MGSSLSFSSFSSAPGPLSSSSESRSCGSYAFDTDGRRGIAVEQGQPAVDYPLVAPSDDIRYLLADAYLAFDDPADYDPALTPFAQPFHLGWLYGLGCLLSIKPSFAPAPTHPVDLVVLDNDGRIVFDSPDALTFASKAWGARLHIYEWRSASAVCRIVVHTRWSLSADDTPEPQQYRLHITPENGVLDARVVDRMPKRIRSLKAVSSTFAADVVDLTGGFNIALNHTVPAATPGRRRVQQVTVVGDPGGGEGRFPGCDVVDPVIRAINDIGTDTTGKFSLVTEGCLFIRQPTEIVSEDPRVIEPTAAMLHLGNDCPPCCTCDDYVDAAKYLNKIGERYRALGVIAENTRDMFAENVARWNSNRDCRLSKPMSLSILPSTCPVIDVAGQYCNQTDECQFNIELTFELSSDPEFELLEGLGVVCDATFVRTSIPQEQTPYVMEGAWPTYKVFWDAVNPHDSVYVRFRVQLPITDDEEAPYALTVSMTGTMHDSAVPIPGGPVVKTVATLCPPLDCV